MPLRKSAKKSAVGKNIEEFHTGKTFAATEAKFGKAKADKQAVGAALETQRQAKKGKK